MATTQLEESQKLTLEEEINLIFRTVFQRTVIVKPKALVRFKEALRANAKDIIEDALKRAVRREAGLTSLELTDLMYAVDRRGEKYKFKIGKSLATATTFSDYGERKMMINYNDDEEEQLDEEPEK